ncbi:hypothetical protein LTR41_010957 [Exophiala xenobiotica]|nr:hypothetical protein LTR41_010957 [Exophiala xenobiotica]KAK5551125.1 hypothetical protein LTR46_010878 [Exophiala xenobiotica]
MWEPFLEAYMSMCTPNMPDFFVYLGPNGAPGSGSFIAMLEWRVEYVAKCVRKLQREHIASMEVEIGPNKAFSAQVDKYFATTIFTYKASSERSSFYWI